MDSWNKEHEDPYHSLILIKHAVWELDRMKDIRPPFTVFPWTAVRKRPLSHKSPPDQVLFNIGLESLLSPSPTFRLTSPSICVSSPELHACTATHYIAHPFRNSSRTMLDSPTSSGNSCDRQQDLPIRRGPSNAFACLRRSSRGRSLVAILITLHAALSSAGRTTGSGSQDSRTILSGMRTMKF